MLSNTILFLSGLKLDEFVFIFATFRWMIEIRFRDNLFLYFQINVAEPTKKWPFHWLNRAWVISFHDLESLPLHKLIASTRIFINASNAPILLEVAVVADRFTLFELILTCLILSIFSFNLKRLSELLVVFGRNVEEKSGEQAGNGCVYC